MLRGLFGARAHLAYQEDYHAPAAALRAAAPHLHAVVLASGWLLAALLTGSQAASVMVAFSVMTALVVVGICDLLQTEHALLRNYPIAGHLRFLVKSAHPEIR